MGDKSKSAEAEAALLLAPQEKPVTASSSPGGTVAPNVAVGNGGDGPNVATRGEWNLQLLRPDL